MSTMLNGLKIVTAKRPSQMTPTQNRRLKLSKKIFEQLQLARALAEGKSYTVTKHKTIRNSETGLSQTIEVNKKIKQWWWVTEGNKVCLTIRYGAKQICFDSKNTKNAIEVTSGEELITALETIKQAVEQGDLDAQIEAVSGSLKANFK
jgi:superfamily I DNA and RNA helicase